jgi:hypothetical protein
METQTGLWKAQQTQKEQSSFQKKISNTNSQHLMEQCYSRNRNNPFLSFQKALRAALPLARRTNLAKAKRNAKKGELLKWKQKRKISRLSLFSFFSEE